MASFIDFTEQLWDWYLSGTEEDLERLYRCLLPQCVYAGTGLQRHYDSAEGILRGMQRTRMKAAARGIHTSAQEFSCQEAMLDSQTGLSYGVVRLYQKTEDGKLCEEQAVRFTLGFHQTDDSWKVFFAQNSTLRQDQTAEASSPDSLQAEISATQRRIRELGEMEARDTLTDLWTLRSLREVYERRIGRESLWLIELELQQFSRVNETLGTTAGNALLKQAAVVLRENAGAGADVARIGGDEFAMLLGDRTLQEIQSISERILNQVKQSCQIGVSIGMVPVSPTESLMQALHRADTQLYQKKQKDGPFQDNFPV